MSHPRGTIIKGTNHFPDTFLNPLFWPLASLFSGVAMLVSKFTVCGALATLVLPAASVWVALKFSVPWPMAVMSSACSA